jgi:mRNA interferase MazF
MAGVDELWLVDFGDPFPGEPSSHRPALIVGPPDTFGPNFPFVLVIPATSVRRGLSLHIEVGPRDANGLDVTSYLQCELIRSISRRRLLHQLGVVEVSTSASVSLVLRTLLGH